MHRDLAAYLVAHKMDATRRDLIVEGNHDRAFLNWVAGDKIKSNTKILEVSTVFSKELVGDDVEEGGKRQRIISLAQQIGETNPRIQFFVDADFDRILKRKVPTNVSFTDYRDLEGYFLSEPCLEKVIQLYIHRTDLEAKDLLSLICRIGREIGFLRLLSTIEEMKLPFQRTSVVKYLRGENLQISVQGSSYLRALLQNAGISLAELPNVEKSWSC